jgi:hypothetical protein
MSGKPEARGCMWALFSTIGFGGLILFLFGVLPGVAAWPVALLLLWVCHKSMYRR